MYLTTNTVLVDRYRVSRLLGQGGMGAVYLAADLRFRNAPVAVKQTLVCAHRDDLRKAFEREAMLLNHLRHPALPRVTDFFVHEDAQFLVMEYVPGSDLSAELDRSGEPLPVGDVVRWVDQLLDALSYMHSQTPPVIHRDIKPQNVRLTPKGDVMLLDFGLSKGSVGGQLTAGSSVVAGTPNYASPEQLGGQGTDERADLFSLAATVYCLLTSAPPPDANQRLMRFVNGQDDPLELVDTHNPEVPRALSNVLALALSLKKDRRPASAFEMRAMWREALRASLPEYVRDLPSRRQHGCGESDGMLVEPLDASTIVEPLLPPGRIDRTPAPTIVEHPKQVDHPRTLVSVDRGPGPPRTPARPARAPAWSPLTYAGIILVSLLAFAFIVIAIRSARPSMATVVDEVVDLGGGVSIEMSAVPAGSFMMGSGNGLADEKARLELDRIHRP